MGKRQLTDEQKAATEEKRRKFHAMVKKVAAMSDEQRAELASKTMVATVEGHTLSLHNQILVALQCPSATLVGGFRQWHGQGRTVRRGEHGISIWVPSKQKPSGGPDATVSAEDLRFFIGSVFDVSQTEVLADESAPACAPAMAFAGGAA